MTKLQTLYVYSNKLTGELPQALSRLPYLRTLLLHDKPVNSVSERVSAEEFGIPRRFE
jgi:hypothetical protein